MQLKTKSVVIIAALLMLSTALGIIFWWKPNDQILQQPQNCALILEEAAPTITETPVTIPVSEVTSIESATQETPDESEIVMPEKIAEKPAKKRVARRNRRRKKAQEEMVSAIPQPTIETTPTAEPVTQAQSQESSNNTLAAADQPLAAEQAPLREVAVLNNIFVENLAVKHWTGTYTPTKLEITINEVPFTIIGDNPIEPGTAISVPCPDNTLTVHYSYEFLHGMRTGTDTIQYTLNDDNQNIGLRFSWDTPWHVELDGATRTSF